MNVIINESQIIKTCSRCNRSETFHNWTVFFLRGWTWRKENNVEIVICQKCGKGEG